MKDRPVQLVERGRVLAGPLVSTKADGNNGAFLVETGVSGRMVRLQVIASDGGGWEHVSVTTCYPEPNFSKVRTPTWDEMQFVKELFWQDDETVFQFHPPQQVYVNLHPHVLHLWKPVTGLGIPLPPLAMV